MGRNSYQAFTCLRWVGGLGPSLRAQHWESAQVCVPGENCGHKVVVWCRTLSQFSPQPKRPTWCSLDHQVFVVRWTTVFYISPCHVSALCPLASNLSISVHICKMGTVIPASQGGYEDCLRWLDSSAQSMLLVSSSLLRKKGSPLTLGPKQKVRGWPERPERKYQLSRGQHQLFNTCLFTYSFTHRRFTEHPLCAEHYIESLGRIRHGTLPLPSPPPLHILSPTARPCKAEKRVGRKQLPLQRQLATEQSH